MNKKLITLAVAGAMFGAGSAMAADVSINGYSEVQWLLTNDFDENEEGQFAVPEVEVNFDSDHLFVAAVATDAFGSDDDSGFDIGQAFLKYGITEGWDLKAGKFDSNFTADYGAAVDREFVQHSLLFQLLADEDVGGDALTGAAVTGDLGMATVTVAYANDSSVNTGAAEGENSIMLLVNASPLDGLDLELGVLTQDEDGGGVGNLMDINGTYAINGFTVGLDYAAGSDNEDRFENGYNLWGGYDFGNGFNVKARFESVSAEDADDVDAYELYASYALNDNLAVAVSLYNVDDGTDDGDINTVQLVGTF